LFGKWSLIVFCGIFEESEIIDVSRTRQGPKRSSSISFLLLSNPQKALLFGKWSLIVFCGIFEESEIIDVSRTRQGPKRSSSISFLLLSILGLQAGLPRKLLAL
jgi:hypothetical protein